MKKIISVILSAALLVFIFIPCSNATQEEYTVHSTDEAKVISPAVWGDLNGDNKVAANDARLCLRAAAQLEKLTDAQLAAADIFATNTVTAANARKILRVAAKLDNFVNEGITLMQGESIVIMTPVPDDSECRWVAYCSPLGFGNVRETAGKEHENGLILTKSEDGQHEYTSVLADTLGNYRLAFYLENESGKQLKTFAITVKVRTDSHITMHVGETFELPELWVNSGTPAQWVHNDNLNEGLTVESEYDVISERETNKYGEVLPGLLPLVYRFSFTACEKGVYEIELIYKYTFNDSPLETLHFTVEVV